MFEINDIVLYNRTEVCRVHEMREMPFLGGKRILYYVLRPVYEDSPSNSTVFVPVDAGESRVRKAFSAAELREMLADDSHRVAWIDSPMIRKKEYTDLLNRSHPVELIGLIRTLNDRRAAKQRTGQKFSEADEKYLSIAEKKLYPLFKYILNVTWEDFLPMVTDRKTA